MTTEEITVVDRTTPLDLETFDRRIEDTRFGNRSAEAECRAHDAAQRAELERRRLANNTLAEQLGVEMRAKNEAEAKLSAWDAAVHSYELQKSSLLFDRMELTAWLKQALAAGLAECERLRAHIEARDRGQWPTPSTSEIVRGILEAEGPAVVEARAQGFTAGVAHAIEVVRGHIAFSYTKGPLTKGFERVFEALSEATEPPATHGSGHEWQTSAHGWPVCSRCGVVRNATTKTPCRGALPAVLPRTVEGLRASIRELTGRAPRTSQRGDGWTAFVDLDKPDVGRSVRGRFTKPCATEREALESLVAELEARR